MEFVVSSDVLLNLWFPQTCDELEISLDFDDEHVLMYVRCTLYVWPPMPNLGRGFAVCPPVAHGKH